MTMPGPMSSSPSGTAAPAASVSSLFAATISRMALARTLHTRGRRIDVARHHHHLGVIVVISLALADHGHCGHRAGHRAGRWWPVRPAVAASSSAILLRTTGTGAVPPTLRADTSVDSTWAVLCGLTTAAAAPCAVRAPQSRAGVVVHARLLVRLPLLLLLLLLPSLPTLLPRGLPRCSRAPASASGSCGSAGAGAPTLVMGAISPMPNARPRSR